MNERGQQHSSSRAGYPFVTGKLVVLTQTPFEYYGHDFLCSIVRLLTQDSCVESLSATVNSSLTLSTFAIVEDLWGNCPDKWMCKTNQRQWTSRPPHCRVALSGVLDAVSSSRGCPVGKQKCVDTIVWHLLFLRLVRAYASKLLLAVG